MFTCIKAMTHKFDGIKTSMNNNIRRISSVPYMPAFLMQATPDNLVKMIPFVDKAPVSDVYDIVVQVSPHMCDIKVSLKNDPSKRSHVRAEIPREFGFIALNPPIKPIWDDNSCEYFKVLELEMELADFKAFVELMQKEGPNLKVKLTNPNYGF